MLRAGGQAACVALLLSFSALGVSTADAASTSARATKVASKLTPAPADAEDPQTTSSVAVDDDRCQRTRKRLWVEGEGWVVRRVTTCF
jgi:hypothetical protein